MSPTILGSMLIVLFLLVFIGGGRWGWVSRRRHFGQVAVSQTGRAPCVTVVFVLELVELGCGNSPKPALTMRGYFLGMKVIRGLLPRKKLDNLASLQLYPQEIFMDPPTNATTLPFLHTTDIFYRESWPRLRVHTWSPSATAIPTVAI